VREPDAWIFRQNDLGDFEVDFDLHVGGGGVEETKESEWEEEVDMEGAPMSEYEEEAEAEDKADHPYDQVRV